MKNKFISLLLITIILIAFKNAYSQSKWIAGFDASYFIPTQELANRFKPAAGGSFFLGKETGGNWTWTGKIEYLKFDKVNKDKLFITRPIDVGNGMKNFDLPIPNLKMELEITGASANAFYTFFQNNFINANAEFGFGIYRWHSYRSSYYDSLYIDTSGTGNLMLAEVLAVPENTQDDWSGGFNIGLDVNAKIFGPLWLNIGGAYKAVIGELWAALALDKENVSTFQIIQLKAGFFVKF